MRQRIDEPVTIVERSQGESVGPDDPSYWALLSKVTGFDSVWLYWDDSKNGQSLINRFGNTDFVFYSTNEAFFNFYI